MQKIKLGMIGGGIGAFIGDTHRRAARISNQFELVGGVFDVDFEKAKEFADQQAISLDRTYPDIDTMIEKEKALPEAERIQVVSIVTPNFLHYPFAKQLLENGFHVVCEKPMTMSVEEAEDLKKVVEKSGLTFVLTHTYTGYPMVRQMREFIKEGKLGQIQRVDAQYYQGWVNGIMHSEDDSLGVWRFDPKVAGMSSCMGDIGVHAFNLIEYTTGKKVTKVLADLNNVVEKAKLDLDGTVMLRFDEPFLGLVRSSQMATGEENNINIAVYGSKGCLKWNQEDPNYLHFIPADQPRVVYKPGNPYNTAFAENSHTMPFGHPEGIYEAFANLYAGAAKSIRGEELQDGEFTNVDDGVRGMKFITQVVASNKDGNVWKEL
ncbi:Gfo/Idh/MocA family protein [Labilibacter marinus]|uniref:Gfo/Idh/MocA family protein n=1 Tax=Labilibacter marinus TaxID=1477105 RepID=UPI00094F613C|nr:Gfo/Idh/MocA family oxidoreductase [Labilibacter marinus]